MKKVLLLLLIFPCIFVSANELTEDYLDIATNYCTYGKYNDAMVYINKILQIEPQNNDVKELKNTLLRIQNPEIKSYLTQTNKNLDKAFLAKKSGDKNAELNALLAMPNDFWSKIYILLSKIN